MEICDYVNTREEGPKDAARAIRKRFQVAKSTKSIFEASRNPMKLSSPYRTFLQTEILKYNAYKKSYPQAIVVGLAKARLDQDFPYWGLADEEIKKQEDYTVKL